MAAAETNVVFLLRAAAERAPERHALIMQNAGGEQSITFANLWQRVDRCSAGLRRAGAVPGDRLLIMIPMSIELYVTRNPRAACCRGGGCLVHVW